MNKRNLRINLKKRWYTMISSGDKKEEYREIKPYWIKRLSKTLAPTAYLENFNEYECTKVMHEYERRHWLKEFDTVTFVLGYTKTEETYECLCITIGRGKPEWGAPDKEVFIIKIGRRIN